MKIGLWSDFSDYYDHWFDYYGNPSQLAKKVNYVLSRQSSDGMPKREQFALLDRAGFAVPAHGTIEQLYEYTEQEYFVGYDDELAHRGEGKFFAQRDYAKEHFPHAYGSIFIPTTDEPNEHAISRRLLAVGDRLWWLKYEAHGSWQSNHAPEVEVSVVSETLPRKSYALEGEHDFSELRRYPMFAIDFVESLETKQLLAIDFNSAPGLKGTGMDSILNGREVVKLLAEYVQLNLAAVR